MCLLGIGGTRLWLQVLDFISVLIGQVMQAVRYDAVICNILVVWAAYILYFRLVR